MTSTDFSGIASRYEKDSLVQRPAAEKLIGLLDVRRDDDVLDLGCGTGSLTRKLRSLTQGRVVGIDLSEGMIREAESRGDGVDIVYRVLAAEALESRDAFTVIFCNSAFQWFDDPALALHRCFLALRPGGRLGIQAPAKQAYCPAFLAATETVRNDRRTSMTYAGFRPPWLFLETAEEYASLFGRAGFSVPFATIETVTTRHSPEEVMAIFESGAAAGYLNQEHYLTAVDADYANAFREIVKGSFREQAGAGGKVELTFNRTYLVAVKA